MYRTVLYNKFNLLLLLWGENGVHKIEHDITFGNKFLTFRRRDILRVPITRWGLLTAARARKEKNQREWLHKSSVRRGSPRIDVAKAPDRCPESTRARDVRALANFAEIYKVSNSDRGDCDWFLDEFRAHLCLTRIWKEKKKRALVNVLETFWIYKCE